MARLFTPGFENSDDAYSRLWRPMPCLCWWCNYLYGLRQSLRDPWHYIGIVLPALALLAMWLLGLLDG